MHQGTFAPNNLQYNSLVSFIYAKPWQMAVPSKKLHFSFWHQNSKKKVIKSYPNNIGYDVYFKSVFDISHNWTGGGRCCRSGGWIGRHSHNEVEWVGGGIATGVHIPNFSLFQLATVKPFSGGPIPVTSKSLQPTISGRIFNIKPKMEPNRIERKIRMDMENFFNLAASWPLVELFLIQCLKKRPLPVTDWFVE